MADDKAIPLNHDGEIPVIAGNAIEGNTKLPRQSHVCCGCCCDTRRATMVVDIISLSFTAIGLVALSMVGSAQYADGLDDDTVKEALSEIDGASLGISIGVMVLGAICYGAGVYGALKYNRWGVIAAGVWYTFEFIRSLIFFDLGSLLIAGFFAYPHIVFVQELNKGIMTPENYPNEEKCCCV